MTVEIMPGMIFSEVPKDAKDIVVANCQNNETALVFSSVIQDPLKCGGDILRLPEGNWTFLFCTADASEEQAASIVQENICDNVKTCPAYKGGDCCGKGEYFDYTDEMQEGEPCYSAKESLQSLLKSKGLNNCAVLKKIN